MTTMRGPSILVRTINAPTKRGTSEAAWQYHSQSDHHSKILCWTVLFDLLKECPAFRDDVRSGTIGVAVNFAIIGPVKKKLDLVVCHRRVAAASKSTFADLATKFGIQLTPEEQAELNSLPSIPEEKKDDVSEVVIALEAKACMTKHSGSLPRLHAEILAAAYLVKLSVPNCIAVSHTLINAASTFRSPGSDAGPNKHKQPDDTIRVLDMLRGAAIPRTVMGAPFGYDVVGVSVINCANDGSTVDLVTTPPSPQKDDFLNYERMIVALCSEYRRKYRS